MHFVTGFNRYPAFQLTNISDVSSPALNYVTSLPRDFSILVTTRPSEREGGYLFAIVNPLNTVIQLGLRLSPVGIDRTNITLLVTDSRSRDSSRIVAEFTVTSLSKEWTRFALKVVDNTVTLFLNCDEYEQVSPPGGIVPDPDVASLDIEPGSTLYIGQAGKLFRGNYIVSIVSSYHGLFF